MEHGPARRPALPTVSLAAAGAAAVSLAVVAVPWLRMSFEAPGLRVALETGGALLAVTTVGLLVRQCGLRSRADHLWLTLGLIVLAGTSLGVAGLIVAGAWTPSQARYAMGGNLAGTVLLAIAAFAPAKRLRVRARAIFAPGLLIAALVFAATSLFAGSAPGAGRVPVQVAIAGTLVIAAAGLARRANHRNEPLLRWVAIAVVLAGFAKLDYALFPPIGAENVHLGDLLRIAAWLALFTGVIEELRRGRIPG